MLEITTEKYSLKINREKEARYGKSAGQQELIPEDSMKNACGTDMQKLSTARNKILRNPGTTYSFSLLDDNKERMFFMNVKCASLMRNYIFCSSM